MAQVDFSDGDMLAILSIPVTYENIREFMEKNKWRMDSLNVRRFLRNSNVRLDDIFETNQDLSFELHAAAVKILAQWLSKKE